MDSPVSWPVLVAPAETELGRLCDWVMASDGRKEEEGIASSGDQEEDGGPICKPLGRSDTNRLPLARFGYMTHSRRMAAWPSLLAVVQEPWGWFHKPPTPPPPISLRPPPPVLLMVRPTWSSDEQTAWLKERMKPFHDSQADHTSRAFFNATTEAFVAKWPPCDPSEAEIREHGSHDAALEAWRAKMRNVSSSPLWLLAHSLTGSR